MRRQAEVMWLNLQAKRLSNGNVKPKSANGRAVARRPVIRQNQPALCFPGLPPQLKFRASTTLAVPCGNVWTQKLEQRKFSRGHLKKVFVPKVNRTPVREIDLAKPWVTEEIINEETKKQKLLESWKESNENGDWRKYKEQKQTVQAVYDMARAEYAKSHPNEPALWEPAPKLNSKHYYCETCDKSFRTDDDLFHHRSEHETCGREGCEFTAHPKIIEKHIKMQHLSGLYKRIGKLYTKEDIAKWIEERKKNYPTRKVIEEKKILEQEKYKRGERIKENDSKFNKTFKNKNRRAGKKQFEKKTPSQKNISKKLRKNKQSVVLKCLEEESLAVKRTVPAFKGTKSTNEPEVQEKQDFEISDEDWEGDSIIPKSTKPLLNNSLRLLASAYDSDIEEEHKSDKEGELEDTPMDDESGPEEVKTVSSRKLLLEETSSEGSRSLKRKFSGKKLMQQKKQRNNTLNDGHSERSLTLLEKLLKKEIRHERNVILQCVHYVIQNNFFKS